MEKTTALIEPVLNSLGPLIDISEESPAKKIQENLKKTVWEFLTDFRYLYKSRGYKYENECRFVIVESDIEDKDEIYFESQKQNNSPAYMRHYYADNHLAIKKLMDSRSLITLGPRMAYRNSVKETLI